MKPIFILVAVKVLKFFLQVAEFERTFQTVDIKEYCKKDNEFNPDVLIMFMGANVDKAYRDEVNSKRMFSDAYDELRSNLIGKNTTVIHVEGFYDRPWLEEEKLLVANKYCDAYVNLGDIKFREETLGMFNHPSDTGMLEISQEIWKVLKNIIINN